MLVGKGGGGARQTPHCSPATQRSSALTAPRRVNRSVCCAGALPLRVEGGSAASLGAGGCCVGVVWHHPVQPLFHGTAPSPPPSPPPPPPPQAIDVGWRVERTSGRDAVSDAMVRGWWQLTEEIVSAGRDHGVDLSSTVHQTAAVIRKQLQALGESLQKPKVASG